MPAIIIILGYAVSFTLACIFPSLIVYVLLFRKEPLAPKKHFRRFQNMIFLMSLFAALISISTMTPKKKFRFSRTFKSKKALVTPVEMTLSSLYSIITIWGCLEPFILCHKARKIKDHYAALSQAQGKSSCCSQIKEE